MALTELGIRKLKAPRPANGGKNTIARFAASPSALRIVVFVPTNSSTPSAAGGGGT